MYLSEYQAKEILARYGVTSRGWPRAHARRGRGACSGAQRRAARRQGADPRRWARAGWRGQVRRDPERCARRSRSAPRPAAGHRTDRPAGRGGQAGLCRGRGRRPAQRLPGAGGGRSFGGAGAARRPRGGVEFEAKTRADPALLTSLALPADGSLEGVDLAGFLAGIGLEGPAATARPGWCGGWSGRRSTATRCSSRSTRWRSARTGGRWRSTPRW